jgi:hypothetical protein
MFKIDPNPTFTAPVSVHVPGQGAGSFVAEFVYLDQEARKDYVAALSGKSNAEALAEIVVGWNDMDAPFSRENLEKLLNKYDTAATGFFKAFFEELRGTAEKN